MPKNSISTLYTTVPNEAVAKELAHIVLDNKLAACVNYFSCQSDYIWLATYHSDPETILIMKTLPSKLDELCKLLESVHPYEVPLINTWPSMVNEKYYKWILETLTTSASN